MKSALNASKVKHLYFDYDHCPDEFCCGHLIVGSFDLRLEDENYDTVYDHEDAPDKVHKLFRHMIRLGSKKIKAELASYGKVRNGYGVLTATTLEKHKILTYAMRQFGFKKDGVFVNPGTKNSIIRWSLTITPALKKAKR